MAWDLDHLRALADLANEKKLAELSLTDGDKTITIKTAASVPVTQAPIMVGGAGAPASTVSVVEESVNVETSGAKETSADPESEPQEEAGVEVITSPMVGTFYAAASPDSPPYVKVGDTVAVGETLCILEAMKQMNELECDLNGTVQAILVKNGDPIEFGQALFKIKV